MEGRAATKTWQEVAFDLGLRDSTEECVPDGRFKIDFAPVESGGPYLAGQEGHLSVCKWLYQAGAAADITKATRWDAGWTPMLVACQKGHLEVCKWLVEMGAAAPA